MQKSHCSVVCNRVFDNAARYLILSSFSYFFSSFSSPVHLSSPSRCRSIPAKVTLLARVAECMLVQISKGSVLRGLFVVVFLLLLFAFFLLVFFFPHRATNATYALAGEGVQNGRDSDFFLAYPTFSLRLSLSFFSLTLMEAAVLWRHGKRMLQIKKRLAT